jgi:hypothetical protein
VQKPLLRYRTLRLTHKWVVMGASTILHIIVIRITHIRRMQVIRFGEVMI